MKSSSGASAGGSVPVLVGPTAVGKTAVALALSEWWELEIVSADSRQIYRHLDVGTAKPTARERARVRHHGLDLVRPGQRYSAGRFARDAARWIREIQVRDRIPVVVGGTGLYVRALTDGLFREPPLDAERRRALERWTQGLEAAELVRFAGRLDPEFRPGGRQRAARAVEIALLTGRSLSWWQRTARAQGGVRHWFVRLTVPRPVLHERIRRRAEEMVHRGIIEEAAAMLAEGLPRNAPGLDAIGMREAVQYLQGERDRESVAAAIAQSTRQYAKRQETWFRHQLPGSVLTLDASRGPQAVAREIVKLWEETG